MDYISGSGTGCAGRTRGWGGSILQRAGLALVALPLLTSAAPLATLELDFTKLRSTRGLLQICLAPAASQFPDCRDGHGAIKRTIPAADGTLRLSGLAPGDYAVAVIHDANGNGKLDTFMGIPREGFGFSRNPVIGFGPPRFSAAQFPLQGGSDRQEVKLRYLL
jgi:uncharacterized protein (DUF2141 family)